MAAKKNTKKSPAARPGAKKTRRPARAPEGAVGRGDPAALKEAAEGRAAGGEYRAKVRMYRQGLGDCFLITLPRAGQKPFHVVIDCGVLLGTEDAKAKMERVVQNIIATTGGRLDLLVATHEHWDHLSGFVQARELWQDGARLQVGDVWLAWSEDPNDGLAQQLRGERHGLRLALAAAAARMRMAGEAGAADEVSGLLEFFGAGGGNSTAAALEVVRNLKPRPRYCRPDDPPVTPAGTDVKIYVLGPPRDEKFIKKYSPSKREPETYGLDSLRMSFGGLSPALSDPSAGTPFDAGLQIPFPAAEQMPFFQSHYWGEDGDSEEQDQGWRQIAASWLDASSALALQLDSATNNTSLVLAFELGDGDVLLFASDAQVGNWLSWQDLSWEVGGSAVTGPDLLGRTVFYKVGHHGSHNATLREKGLEQMKSLELAFLSVDRATAVKKRWNKMPLGEIVERLHDITEGAVVRIDEAVPEGLKYHIDGGDPLFYEVTL